jgi:phosphodiesterase/alkaline phosphatase D-like protein
VPPPCRVYTLAACDVGYTGAILWGLLICHHPPAPVTVSFGWDSVSHKNDPAGYSHWTPGKKLFFGLLFQAALSGLQPNTTYYFRARAQTAGYTDYGEELRFTTPPELRVITLPACKIENKQATLNGMTIGRTHSKVKASFGWDTVSRAGNPGGYRNWTSAQDTWIGDIFNAKLTNLRPNTTYYFRARVVKGGTIFYGEEMSFTTRR